jgi:glutaredoxin
MPIPAYDSYQMTRPGIILLALLLALGAGTAWGKIYKWVDTEGRTHFSSSPPQHGKAEIVRPKTNSRQNHRQAESGKGSSSARKGKPKKVVMYSAVWCGICKQARRYFKNNNIPFREYDIETSQKGRHDFKRLRGRGVPIIMVGERMLNGFDPKAFKDIYNG